MATLRHDGAKWLKILGSFAKAVFAISLDWWPHYIVIYSIPNLIHRKSYSYENNVFINEE